LEKGVEAEIASFENECSVEIDWGSTEDISQPANYVEHWRLLLGIARMRAESGEQRAVSEERRAENSI
jgi:hypothetical protein